MQKFLLLTISLLVASRFAEAQILPVPDPVFGSPPGGPGGGTVAPDPPADSEDCCKAPLIRWSGKSLPLKHGHNQEHDRVEVIKDVPAWTDLWSGDDECYQKAETSPPEINLLKGATAPVDLFVLAQQSFEMVDYSILTAEVGFPADHVHPLAEISGYLQWGYAIKPMPGETLPGLRISASVFATSSTRSSGAHSVTGSSASSSGNATASVEWRHPCACRNPVIDDNGATGPFFIDSRVAEGKCEMVTETKEKVSAEFNGKSATKSRTGEEPEFEGQIGVSADWERQVSVLLDGTTYIVKHEIPSASRELQAETAGTELRMPFRCFASVFQNGTADDGFLTYAVAKGEALARAGISVGNIQITPLVGSALPKQP